MLLGAMLDTAVLHIGMNQTGTAAIQSGLALNRARLHALGFHYPQSEPAKTALQDAFETGDSAMLSRLNELFEKDEFNPNDLDGYIDEVIAEAGTPSLIFSSEQIGGFHPEFAAALGATLKARFKTLRVVMFVRHVADHALSQYGEAVKRQGLALDFETYARDGYVCWFEAYASRAVQAYGPEAVSVVLYDDVADKAFDAFLDTAGIPSKGFEQTGPGDPPLSASEAALFRRLNRLTTNAALIEKVTAEFSSSETTRHAPLSASRAAIEAIAESSARDIAYINSEFPLTSPLLDHSSRLPIDDADAAAPDVDGLTAMLNSAIRGAAAYARALRGRKRDAVAGLTGDGAQGAASDNAAAESPEDLQARRERRDRRAARRVRRAAKKAASAATAES